MRKHRDSDAVFYLPRHDTSRKYRPPKHERSMKSTEPTHFLPSFAVRRPVIATPETEQFYSDSKRLLGRQYDVERLFALTLVEQQKMVHVFRDREIAPTVDRMEDVARFVARLIGEKIKSSPRRTEIPTGRVFRFGAENRRLGIVPLGWQGYTANYANRDQQGNRLPMPMIVRESATAIGGITNALAEEYDDLQVSLTDIGAETPHFSFARHRRHEITQAEHRALVEPLSHIMPEVVTVFDPVIFLRRSQHEPVQIICVRSPGEYSGLVDSLSEPTASH